MESSRNTLASFQRQKVQLGSAERNRPITRAKSIAVAATFDSARTSARCVASLETRGFSRAKRNGGSSSLELPVGYLARSSDGRTKFREGRPFTRLRCIDARRAVLRSREAARRLERAAAKHSEDTRIFAR